MAKTTTTAAGKKSPAVYINGVRANGRDFAALIADILNGKIYITTNRTAAGNVAIKTN